MFERMLKSLNGVTEKSKGTWTCPTENGVNSPHFIAPPVFPLACSNPIKKIQSRKREVTIPVDFCIVSESSPSILHRVLSNTVDLHSVAYLHPGLPMPGLTFSVP